MGRRVLLAGLLFLAGACAETSSQRVRELNDDGVHLYEKGRFEHARETFEAALALSPEDPDILYNLGRCHEQVGRQERAEQVYRQVLQLAPEHGECRHSLVVLLTETKRRPEANRLVQGWLEKEPSHASPYAEDAWLLMKDGDLIGARTRLQQAVTLEPNNSRALTEMGRLYEKLNYPDRAIVMYERSLAFDPRQPDVARQVSLLRSQGTGRPHPE